MDGQGVEDVFGIDAAASEEGFGNTDHHLGVVGVPGSLGESAREVAQGCGVLW